MILADKVLVEAALEIGRGAKRTARKEYECDLNEEDILCKEEYVNVEYAEREYAKVCLECARKHHPKWRYSEGCSSCSQGGSSE